MKFFLQVHVEIKSMHAKFYGSETNGLAVMAKKTFFLHFLGNFWVFLGQKRYLNFAIWSEILHEYAPGDWQLVCKIWCNWLEGFGRSKAIRPKVSKNAKFCTPNFQTLNGFFVFFCFWTIIKLCIQVNMPMED